MRKTIEAAGGVRHAREPRVADERLRRVLAGEEFLLFDGAMGTMLQERGLAAGELPELLNLSDPDGVRAIHAAYVEAGADVVTTNTRHRQPALAPPHGRCRELAGALGGGRACPALHRV